MLVRQRRKGGKRGDSPRAPSKKPSGSEGSGQPPINRRKRPPRKNVDETSIPGLETPYLRRKWISKRGRKKKRRGTETAVGRKGMKKTCGPTDKSPNATVRSKKGIKTKVNGGRNQGSDSNRTDGEVP